MEEYIQHITYIMDLLKTYDHFNIQIVKRPTEDQYTIYAREELGVIVAKTSMPAIILAINESNMTAAFWDFLKDIIGEKNYENPNNESVFNFLQAYIKNLHDEGK